MAPFKKLRFGTDLEIPWGIFEFLGCKFSEPHGLESVPELEGLVFGESPTGFPVSAIRPDEDWNCYLNEVSKVDYDCTKGVLPSPIEALFVDDSVPEVGWSLRGGQLPTPFHLGVVRGNLTQYRKEAKLDFLNEKNVKFHDGALGIVFEALVANGMLGFTYLSEYEVWYGTPDGHLGKLNLDTAIGALIKLGDSKKQGFEVAPEFMLHITRYDRERTKSFDPMLAWPSKYSLKDARLAIEKIAAGKGRIFQAQSMPVATTGRWLIGDFIARFMKASKEGGFPSIIGFVLSRGGWHELLKDLSFGWAVDEQDSGDASKWDKNWLNYWHYVICVILSALTQDEEHSRLIFRHYDRVIRSPGFMTIIGWLVVLTKGQPSGDIATIVFNTIGQWIMYAQAYCSVAPPEFWTYRDMEQNCRARLGGDDSVSCLSRHMRAWLARPYYPEQAPMTWAEKITDTFSQSGWEVILVSGSLMDIEFMGYNTVLVDYEKEGYGVWHLPALPMSTVMSINEWWKRAKNRDVPLPVKQLARYYACVEKAFPHIWGSELGKAFFTEAWRWLEKQVAIHRNNPCVEVRSAARGVPTIRDIADVYFPVPIPQALIYERLRK